MDRFGKLHPMVILVYYAVAAGLLIFVAHPAVALVMGGTALLYYITLAGVRAGLIRLLWGWLISVACFVINALLNHRGVTLLFRLGDMRVTGEALLYGGNMALILLASLQIFSCLSHTMTAEKIMTLTARRFPSFSLLFSMILRLVPKAAKDYREMTGLHGNRPAVWSALIGIQLEDSMRRGMSMKARGYGGKERSSFYKKKMSGTDLTVLALLSVLAVLLISFWYGMGGEVRFFPGVKITPLPAGLWVILFLYGSLPLMLRGKEEMTWYVSRRRITGSAIPDSPDMRWR